MAIQPIEQFRNQDNSLLQILQGGSNVITGIFDRAIQIGRDVSNKRTQQEQNLLGIRGQERALAQRSAQDLQQNIEDAQRFARGAYEFDVKFGANRADTAFSQNRQTTNDAFSQADADRNFGLAQDRVGIAQQGVDLRTQEIQAEAEAAQAARDQTAALYSGTPTAPTQEGPQTLLDAYNAPVAPSRPSKSSPQYKAALSIVGNTKATPQARAQAQAVLDAAGGVATSERPMTAYQKAQLKLSQEDNELARQKFEAEKAKPPSTDKAPTAENKILVEQNTDAFPYSGNPALLTKTDLTPAEQAQKNAASDQYGVEVNAIIKAPSKEAYVNLLPGATPAQKKLREELYDRVKGGSTAPAPSSTSPLRFATPQ